MPFIPARGHKLLGESRSGYWVQVAAVTEPFRAFVPKALPRVPNLQLRAKDFDLLERANRAIGRLDGISDTLPDIDLFLSVWLFNEAVYSSQIEGTQSSLSDLLVFEIEQPAEAIDDLRETANYVTAARKALGNLDTLPVSMRLLRTAHEQLLASGRGSERQPGMVRHTQNWIGGTRPGNASYVPPPPEYLDDALSALDNYMNDVPERTPLLVKTALAHAQFESIHPFLDGNGRLGRLLIVLLFCSEKALRHPVLYVSLYFKKHRDTYYELLQQVRTDGAWEEWVRFFLEAVEWTSEKTVASARKALQLFEEDRKKISSLGQASGSALQVLDVLEREPITNIVRLGSRLNISRPTLHAAIRALERLEIVQETTGLKRNRLYAYTRYMQILQQEDEASE